MQGCCIQALHHVWVWCVVWGGCSADICLTAGVWVGLGWDSAPAMGNVLAVLGNRDTEQQAHQQPSGLGTSACMDWHQVHSLHPFRRQAPLGMQGILWQARGMDRSLVQWLLGRVCPMRPWNASVPQRGARIVLYCPGSNCFARQRHCFCPSMVGQAQVPSWPLQHVGRRDWRCDVAHRWVARAPHGYVLPLAALMCWFGSADSRPTSFRAVQEPRDCSTRMAAVPLSDSVAIEGLLCVFVCVCYMLVRGLFVCVRVCLSSTEVSTVSALEA